MEEPLIVIGGGVSGITSALVLQLLGFDTTIYAEKTFNQITNKDQFPEFASLFPSASVIPHSVYTDKLELLFTKSQSVFYELRKHSLPGLTIHKHYEVFEFEREIPEYSNWMPNWQSIDELASDSIPRKNNKQPLNGWAFDCIFADWPLYFPALIKWYKNAGGEVIREKLKPNDISKLPASIIVNCSGTGSPFLFKDPQKEQRLLRGHLIHKLDMPLITNKNGDLISYNYTPEPSVYADLQGQPCDVYCYPRKDGWYLGGSRQAGMLTEKGNWSGRETEYPSYEIDGLQIPKPIIDLNREILSHTYGLELKTENSIRTTIGYRYIRNRENGLRLEEETTYGKRVIHNYGHGGAGVTLSWGCAIEVANNIMPDKSSNLKAKVVEALETYLSENS